MWKLAIILCAVLFALRTEQRRTDNGIRLSTAPGQYITKRINETVEAVLDEYFSYSNELRSTIKNTKNNIERKVNTAGKPYKENMCVILFEEAERNATIALNEWRKCIDDKLNSEVKILSDIKHAFESPYNLHPIQKCAMFSETHLNYECSPVAIGDDPDFRDREPIPHFVERRFTEINDPSVRQNIINNCSNLSGIDFIRQKLRDANDCIP